MLSTLSIYYMAPCRRQICALVPPTMGGFMPSLEMNHSSFIIRFEWRTRVSNYLKCFAFSRTKIESLPNLRPCLRRCWLKTWFWLCDSFPKIGIRHPLQFGASEFLSKWVTWTVYKVGESRSLKQRWICTSILTLFKICCHYAKF